MYLRLSPYREILQGVLTSLQVNEGIIKITGKSGAGKTALCSQLFHELEGNEQPAVFFLKPPASAIALQNDILDNLHLDSTGNFTRTLTTYLLARSPAQGPLVLIFDDAQQLDAQTFGAIRMLCNIQDQSRALIRTILCGNEELDARLEGHGLRAVTQFLSQSFTVPYLTQEQVGDFCQGYWQLMNEDTKPLSEGSLQKLYKETRGQPGILQARLNQGTTGAERIDRFRDPAVAAAPALPYKYAGPRPGWIPAMLILAGLLLVGGTGNWYFFGRERITNDSATLNPSPPPASEPAPVIIASAVTPAAIPAPLPAPEDGEVALDSETGVAVFPQPEPETSAASGIGESAAPQPEEDVAATEVVETAVSTAPPMPNVEQFIADWTTSWQSQDVDAYLAHYHPEFTPAQGLAREAWREQRRRVIGNAANIAISVEAPEFTGDDANGGRIVRFWMNYSAANYADRTLKELLLVPVDGEWRIRNENNLRTERQ